MKHNLILSWPPLPYAEWKDTRDTLHLWTQIVGKTKLRLNPFLNHYWEVVLYVTATGLATGRIPYGKIAFGVEFDFTSHRLRIVTSEGKKELIPLKPRTVSDFYKEYMRALENAGMHISITPTPSEVPNPIPFKENTAHASYDKEYVARWQQIQLQASFVFDRFSSTFRGKNSPVQFFWGSFDLSQTRFSGKKLPDKVDWPRGYSFMRYAENEENFACGFWPGDERFPHPAFYSYMYPAPKGFEAINAGSAGAFFSRDLSEWILPYEDARGARDPEKTILNFLETTYRESAKLSKWDAAYLEGLVPKKR